MAKNRPVKPSDWERVIFSPTPGEIYEETRKLDQKIREIRLERARQSEKIKLLREILKSDN